MNTGLPWERCLGFGGPHWMGVMCEYCGCQSLATVDLLTREHEGLVNLMGSVRAAHDEGDVACLAELAREVSAILQPHTAVEERALFPPVVGDFGPQIDLLHADHRAVEAVLGEAVDQLPGDPGWPERFVGILGPLRDHILREQDGVFPAPLTSLDPHQWTATEAARAQVGCAIPADESAEATQ